MKRMLSVWLPAWPITRLAREERGSVPAREPFSLVDLSARGMVITAVNEEAAREGISPGTLLADARAALPHLRARLAEKSKDDFALFKLAQWAGRYGPSRSCDGEDGFWVDVTGVAHLFGGEERLVRDLIARLSGFSISARAGLADTLGAAHAFARYAGKAGPSIIVPMGKAQEALSPLPVEALRIDADTAILLRRLGLKRIGQLYDIPREALAQRFNSADAAGRVLLRLDQALGRAAEPLKPFHDAPAFAVRRAFPEPLISSDALENFIFLLCEELAAALKEKDMGTRTLFLAFYRADGTVAETGTRMRGASNDAAHFKMLLERRLQKVDAGFGVDLLVLEATQVSPLKGAQPGFGEDERAGYDPGPLIDRLSNRFGGTSVVTLAPCASHIPELSETRVAAFAAPPLPIPAPNGERARRDLTYAPPWPYGKTPLRPSFLLARPEPISVVAEIPDGPPARFVWRRVERRIARAEGPERIAPEWWRASGLRASGQLPAGEPEAPNKKLPRPRDYYRIEDEKGDAYWVFRHGLYGGEDDEEDGEESNVPRWYLHGLFA